MKILSFDRPQVFLHGESLMGYISAPLLRGGSLLAPVIKPGREIPPATSSTTTTRIPLTGIRGNSEPRCSNEDKIYDAILLPYTT
ncbi:hypothetical protein TNCV_5104941 [Trichonephila clavipes]|nr:hypothetical protein TNCV_5104941 [Trichonephila clavipes]